MKTILLAFTLVFALSACNQPTKDGEKAVISTPVSNDDISKNIMTDQFGDEMEIIRNNTQNKITIKLNGKTYELKENEATPGFSTDDNKYLFTETKNEVTFTNKDLGMVLFKGSINKMTKLATQ